MLNCHFLLGFLLVLKLPSDIFYVAYSVSLFGFMQACVAQNGHLWSIPRRVFQLRFKMGFG
jgi:hypothetical protein